MCGAYSNDTLQILTFHRVVGYRFSLAHTSRKNWQVPRVSHQATAKVQSTRYGSFAVRGPRLFNTLPSELRNMTNCSSESFKQALDTFLKTIRDEPQTPGYTCMRRAESNPYDSTIITARHPSISEELDS